MSRSVVVPDVVVLAELLDDPDELEPYLQTAFVDSVLDEDLNTISVDYYGAETLNVGSDQITAEPFDLSGYQIKPLGFGGFTLRIQASAVELLPGQNCEFGPGGHDIETHVSHVEYRAEITVDQYGYHGSASVILAPMKSYW